jgi:Na+/melibiose symporter-like transporter
VTGLAGAARSPTPFRRRLLAGGAGFLPAFALAAAGVGLGRAITTTYVPVLLDRIEHAPGLIGVVMLGNAVTGFFVPLVVGVWSDRTRNARVGRRVPFMVAGTGFAMGGLVAIALGTSTSYLVLGAAAVLVYVGLNATTTAHRAIVAESFDEQGRPAATSAQELAMLAGAMAGILAGGALAASSPGALFAIAAVALPVVAAPTIATAISLRRRRAGREGEPATDGGPSPAAEAGVPRARARDLAWAVR